jgi:transposase
MLASGQRISHTQLWRVLKKLGLRLKKVAPVRRDKPA